MPRVYHLANRRSTEFTSLARLTLALSPRNFPSQKRRLRQSNLAVGLNVLWMPAGGLFESPAQACACEVCMSENQHLQIALLDNRWEQAFPQAICG
jgi:hypothetical protein